MKTHTSLQEIIQESGIALCDTLYGDCNRETLTFQINTTAFWNLEDERELQTIGAYSHTDGEYAKITERLLEVKRQIKKIKETDDKEHKQVDVIKELRREKKKLEGQINGMTSCADTSKKKVIRFKRTTTAVDFNILTQLLPALKQMSFPGHKEMPYFTGNLVSFAERIERQEELGVTGGPCLFGMNEVDVCIMLMDGTSQTFDYSTGRHFVRNDLHVTTYVKKHAPLIREVTFVNHKVGVTSQEYDSIYYLFEIALALDAKVTIPIPDMSYVKYVKGIFQYVNKETKSEIVKRFRRIAYEITDMYLEVIKELQEKYPTVQVTVIHEREKELCRVFEERRKKYIEVNGVLRNITGIPEKKEAIKDYISMPAMPYYIYGIKNILQIDSIDETDSYRKCKMAHKGVLNLSCILYPERISADGENTIFFAERQYKEYRNRVYEQETFQSTVSYSKRIGL